MERAVAHVPLGDEWGSVSMLRTSDEALTGKVAGRHIRRGGHDGHTVVDVHRGGWVQCN